jgi:hypothetical protein
MRVAENWTTHPVANILRVGGNKCQEFIENLEVPWGKKTRKQQETQQELQHQENEAYTAINTPISNNNSSGNSVNYSTSQVGTQEQSIYPVPPLEQNKQIKGRKGNYQITSGIVKEKEKGRVRFYNGIQVNQNKKVLIQEFLLVPPDFNEEEAKKCQNKFEQLYTITFNNGKGQDFRLITPLEVIADSNKKYKNCYLISEEIDKSETLREYQIKNQFMKCEQVREVIKQVLQSLHFLHSKKVNIPREEFPERLSNLYHGNISLDSLLIVQNEDTKDFFIYLKDLSLWENACNPPASKTTQSTQSQQGDLRDLGKVCYKLLLGSDKEPADEKKWNQIREDENLSNYIRHLLGTDKQYPAFSGAEEALRVILNLPYNERKNNNSNLQQTQAGEQLEEEEEYDNSNNSLLKPLSIVTTLFIVAGLASVTGFAISYFWNHRGGSAIAGGNIIPCQSTKTTDNKAPYCNIGDVKTDVEVENDKTKKQQKTYIDSSYGIWSYLRTKPLSLGKTFDAEFQRRVNGKFSITNNITKESSLENSLGKLNQKIASFVITVIPTKDMVTTKENNPNFDFEVIAYDALVPLVAFSNSQQQKDKIPPVIFQEKITLDELRDLYTKAKGSSTTNLMRTNELPIKLYLPSENIGKNKDKPKIVELFKKLALITIDDAQQQTKLLDVVNNIFNRELKSLSKQHKAQDILKSEQILKKIFNDFQNGTISLSVDLLSQVIGQCTVYPLAVVNQKGEEVQLLMENNGNKITPQTDLCRKGSYRANINALRDASYPLGYSITVVYPKDSDDNTGKMFAEMLQSDEGQSLLRGTGLVPVREIE